jgi:hypothetical protein
MHCQGKTKSGKPCKRTCKGKYCFQHQKKYPRRSPKKSDDDLQRRYCSCLLSVEAKGHNVNKYKICTASVGRVSKSCKAYGH